MEEIKLKTWEETVAAINASPRRGYEIDMLSLMWEVDWHFFETVYCFQGMGNEEILRRKSEYFEGCRKQMMDAFQQVGCFL